MKLIDLHTHSTASDGTDSPSELVAKAAGQGLAALALTDHDTARGLDEAEEAAKAKGIEFIRGCELSTSTDQGEMHVLGLFLPHDCGALDGFLQCLREGRKRRNVLMVEKLREAGLDISMEEVEAKARSSVGRPHMAAVLKEKGYVRDTNEAFDKWLGIKGKAYVPKLAPRPEQAVRILRELGASPVLAHPLLRPRPEGWLDNLVRDLKPAGLFGLEAWHSAQNEAQEAEIKALARKYDLGLSGGSDYHGRNKPDIQLGTGKGNLRVEYKTLEKLKGRRRALGLPC